MYNNNNNMRDFQPQGVSYNNHQLIKGTQPLSDEEMKQLQEHTKTVDYSINTIDILAAKCVHRNKAGQDATVEVGGNRVRCTICNKEFDIIDYSPEQVEQMVAGLVDVLQTIKVAWRTIPQNVVESMFVIIPILQQVPHLHKVACKKLDELENVSNYNGVYGNSSVANMVHGLMNGGNQGYGMNPGYAPQQGFDPNYGMAQQSVYNNGMQGGYVAQQNQAPMYDQMGNPIYNNGMQGGYVAQQNQAPTYDQMGNPIYNNGGQNFNTGVSREQIIHPQGTVVTNTLNTNNPTLPNQGGYTPTLETNKFANVEANKSNLKEPVQGKKFSN